MNLRAATVAVILMGVFLFFVACDSKKKEALRAVEKARQEAETGLENVKERAVC